MNLSLTNVYFPYLLSPCKGSKKAPCEQGVRALAQVGLKSIFGPSPNNLNFWFNLVA